MSAQGADQAVAEPGVWGRRLRSLAEKTLAIVAVLGVWEILSRTVIDPRSVLKDFGVTLPAETEIRVWDSTAETRFIVLPMRPAGTEGWSEDKLADLVTRDSMIGTGLPKAPGAAS